MSDNEARSRTIKLLKHYPKWLLIIACLFICLVFLDLKINTRDIIVLTLIAFTFYKIKTELKKAEKIVSEGTLRKGIVTSRYPKKDGLLLAPLVFYTVCIDDKSKMQFRLHNNNFSRRHTSTKYELPQEGESIELFYHGDYPKDCVPNLSKLFREK